MTYFKLIFYINWGMIIKVLATLLYFLICMANVHTILKIRIKQFQRLFLN